MSKSTGWSDESTRETNVHNNSLTATQRLREQFEYEWMNNPLFCAGIPTQYKEECWGVYIAGATWISQVFVDQFTNFTEGCK